MTFFPCTLGAQSSSINYIHIIWELLPPSVSRTLSFHAENQSSLNNSCPFPPPLSPFYSCIYTADGHRDPIAEDSYRVPFCDNVCHWTSSHDSSVVYWVRIAILPKADWYTTEWVSVFSWPTCPSVGLGSSVFASFVLLRPCACSPVPCTCLKVVIRTWRGKR